MRGMHDGTLTHFLRPVRRYLEATYHYHWTGSGTPVAWPPRPSDLNPSNYYLWGHLKVLAFRDPVPDINNLGERIVDRFDDIRTHDNVFNRLRHLLLGRVEACIVANETYFKHFPFIGL